MFVIFEFFYQNVFKATLMESCNQFCQVNVSKGVIGLIVLLMAQN